MKRVTLRLLKRSRLIRYSTLLTVIISLILFSVLYFIKTDFDRNLGITGFFFGLLQLLFSRLESKNPKMRNIVFLSKSKSTFSQSIYKGLRNILESNRDISVSAIFPENYGNATDTVTWQIEELKHNNVLTKADAIVIIPAKDEIGLWQSLVSLVSKGVSVICLDVKPIGSFFDSAKVPRPYFISSDFSVGGKLLGAIIQEELKSENVHFIGAIGPDNSWPAVERCSKLLTSIIHNEEIKSCSWLKLISWDREECAKTLLEKINTINLDKISKLIVFAGNDKVAISLLRKIPNNLYQKIRVIGYDGLKDESNTLVMNQYPEFIATIDTLAIEQGKSAGQIINNIHKGEVPDFKSHYVKPKIRRNNNVA